MAVDVFTSSGTWTCPAGVTSAVVECWGGGAGGSSSGPGATGGGGAGSYCTSTLTVVPSTGYTVTVGTGGGDATAGNPTWFNTSSTIYAIGGLPANQAGFDSNIGDLIHVGGAARGGSGKGSHGGSGGASSGCPTADGIQGSANSGSTGGSGGASAGTDSGAGGNGGNTGASGQNGTAPGGGGGGPGTTGTPAGTGANGQVRITYTTSSAFTCDPVGSLSATGIATERTTGTWNAVGNVIANGVATQRTGGLWTALGNLFNLAGVASTSSGAAFTYQASGSIASLANTGGGSPYLTGTFTTGGGVGRVVSPANSDNVQVGGVWNAVGLVGGITSPDGGRPQLGYRFEASGVLGSPSSNSGEDVEVDDGSDDGGDDDNPPITRTDVFTPCCTLPEKVQTNCCGCPSDTWQWWEITQVDQFAEAICSGVGLGGSFNYPLTSGCILNTTSALRFLGPSPAIGVWSPTQNKCGWMSWPFVNETFGGGGDPFYGGHGSPPTSEFIGCCFLDLGGTRCQKRVGWTLSCETATSAVFVPQVDGWRCNFCNSWCGDGGDFFPTLEECEEASTPGTCYCCEPDSATYGTSQQCVAAACGDCSQVIISPQSYTPPFPAAWYLSYFGPCGCNLTFISTTSDHPLYGFYQPTSGLDQTDACGNFYYQYWGALDATGPFDCTSGGRFTLMNFVQPVFDMGIGCFTSDIPICNQMTNVWMGRDPVCATECNGYNFADCHPGCIAGGNYATVEPIPTERVLPHTNWIPPDPYGNPLCCERSSDGSSGMAMTMAMGMALMETMPDDSLRFTYGMFAGAMVQTSENSWRVNYPPLSFELVKLGTKYTVNGIEVNVLLADPLMLSVEIGGEVLEVYGR